MRKAIICLLGAGVSLISPLSFGQDIEVSDPELDLVGYTLHINYEILNSTPDQEFMVEMVVTDEDGNRINAAALNGDVGEKVYGGNGKQITWDLEADRIEIDADIFIKLHVKAILSADQAVPPAEREIPEPMVNGEEEIPDEVVRIEDATADFPATSDDYRYNRGGLIGLSALFPGTGLTIHKGGPHWIKGVLVYGCLTGSIALHMMAINTYDGIIEHAGFDAKNEVYQKSLRQDQTSEILAWTALAIWVSDMVWTIVGTSDMNRGASHSGRFGVDPAIDPVTSAPLIALTYRF